MNLSAVSKMSSTLAGLAFSALFAFAAIAISAERAEAVVYCAAGVVRAGCVVRPVAPVARAAVLTPGVGAPGVGVRAGTPMNRGGPVNRVGRR